jgi:uncharacterized protein (TIGR02466 family)
MATTHKFTLGGLTPAPTPAPVVQRNQIFPTTLWQVRLTPLAPRFPDWIGYVAALRAASPAPAGRTNRGGWNSQDSAVLDQPMFAPLDQAVRDYCRLALGEMGAGDMPFALQSWINVHDRGGFNFLHMHDGALLSGCFYLRVPPGSGSLTFRDPRPGVLNSFAKGSGANACKEVNLRPDDGLLVLFPHWLEHYVEPHAGDEARIVIAFNALRP